MGSGNLVKILLKQRDLEMDVKGVNMMSELTYEQALRAFQDKYMEMDLYFDAFDKFCSLVSEKKLNVLEIGCGPGNLAKYLLQKRHNCSFLGIDPNHAMIELARINNPDADFSVMTDKEFTGMKGNFDVIITGFYLPLLSKKGVVNVVAKVADLLKQGGLFYLSTIEGESHETGFEVNNSPNSLPVHIYYHEKEFIMQCLKIEGFDVVDIVRKRYPDPENMYFTDMIYFARKKL